MATVNSVKIKLAYEDATSRLYTFNGVEQTALSGVKTRVININDSLESGTAEAFANTFVSAAGAKCKMISQAQIIKTEQEVIYNAS